jgi:hypothetical protein
MVPRRIVASPDPSPPIDRGCARLKPMVAIGVPSLRPSSKPSAGSPMARIRTRARSARGLGRVSNPRNAASASCASSTRAGATSVATTVPGTATAPFAATHARAAVSSPCGRLRNAW